MTYASNLFLNVHICQDIIKLLLTWIESKNKDSSVYQNNYVDCGEAIKVEDIETIKKEESVEDPLFIQQENKSTLCGGMKVEDYIKEEIKAEGSVVDPLSVQQETESDNLEDFVDYDQIDVEDFKVKSNEED